MDACLETITLFKPTLSVPKAAASGKHGQPISLFFDDSFMSRLGALMQLVAQLLTSSTHAATPSAALKIETLHRQHDLLHLVLIFGENVLCTELEHALGGQTSAGKRETVPTELSNLVARLLGIASVDFRTRACLEELHEFVVIGMQRLTVLGTATHAAQRIKKVVECLNTFYVNAVESLVKNDTSIQLLYYLA